MEIARLQLESDVISIGGDIVQSERFMKAWSVPHHSKEKGNVALHSLMTAQYALAISRWLKRRGVAVNEKDVVRASLLHDVGMTEDDVYFSPSRIKAHAHPEEGSRIAREEFGANDVQADAILRHMWPIGHVAPRSTEGWVLVAADKCCSMREVPRICSSGIGRLANKVSRYQKKAVARSLGYLHRHHTVRT